LRAFLQKSNEEILMKKFTPYLSLISILMTAQSAFAESIETQAAKMDVFYSYCFQIDPVGATAGKPVLDKLIFGEVDIPTIRLSQRYKDEYQKAKSEMAEKLKGGKSTVSSLPEMCQYYGLSSAAVDLSQTLFSTANEGDVVNVKRLIAAGADVNAKNKDGNRAIHYAARGQGGQGAKAILLLIAAGAKVDWVDNNGSTPIYVAAEAGNVEAIEALLGAGANPNTPNNRGWLPIERALNFEGYSKAVKALIRGGANVNLPDSYRNPMISRVAMMGDSDVDLFNDFLKAGASVNACATDGEQPIHSAANWGRPALLKAMIAAGANVNAATPAGTQPIHKLVGNIKNAKNVQSLTVLIEAGSNVNATDGAGMRPIDLAKKNGSVGMVNILLAAGAMP
jgi:ankyrin repeat protein